MSKHVIVSIFRVCAWAVDVGLSRGSVVAGLIFVSLSLAWGAGDVERDVIALGVATVLRDTVDLHSVGASQDLLWGEIEDVCTGFCFRRLSFLGSRHPGYDGLRDGGGEPAGA